MKRASRMETPATDQALRASEVDASESGGDPLGFCVPSAQTWAGRKKEVARFGPRSVPRAGRVM